jgi:hypothetical protein
MWQMYSKRLGTVVLTFVLCLTGLFIVEAAQAFLSTQSGRFLDNGNGTVTDNQTGLMWTKVANPIGKVSWNDAMSACGSFSISGIGGWRLPNTGDLQRLSQELKSGHPFVGVQSANYWSSSASTDGAYSVDMNNGSVVVDIETKTLNAWPVRAASH